MPPFYARLFAATALCSVSVAAQAQDAATNDAFQLDRIIFGFGSPRVAIDTPQAVTSVDQEDIDREQAATPAELLDAVPGVQSIGSNRAAGTSFNIRGIGELAASDESRIVVTVDGATKFHEQYRVGSFFGDPELYKRVEVLRGPASSTLIGAGAIGGAIAFETKDASDFLTEDTNTALRFRTSYTSNGEGGAGTVIFATRPSDRAEFLASLTYRTANDFEDGDGNAIPGSEFDAVSGLIKGTFKIDDAQSVEVSYSAYDSDLDDTAYSQTGTLPFGTIDRSVRDQTLTLNYANTAPGNDLIDLDVTLFYFDTQVEQSDSQNAPFGFGGSVLFDDTDYGYRTVGVKVENTSRLNIGSETFLTYGIQASRQERTAQATRGALAFHPEGTDTRIGIYAQAEMVFGALTLIPGLRVDFSDLEPDAAIPGVTDVSNTAVSPKLAAIYKFNDSFSAFGSISRTERAPTIDELFSTEPRTGAVAALTLEPEVSDAIELGFSYQREGVFGADDTVAVKVTGFNYDIDGLIERPAVPDRLAGVPFYIQIGEARLRGVEIEGAYESDRVYARMAYAYTDGEDLTTGANLSSVPAENLTLTLGGRNKAGTLDYGWQGTFVDDITTPGAFGRRFDGYAVHDVYASYTPTQGVLEGWEVRAGVDNVFDKDYRNSLSGDDGLGRTLKLTLTKGLQW